MSRCGTCGCQVESPFDGKTVIHDTTRCGSLAAPTGSALLTAADVHSSKLVLLNRLLSLIDIRRRSAQREVKDAIENKQWSKVPGWDGIDIGLMMAEKTIKEEMQQNNKLSHGKSPTP